MTRRRGPDATGIGMGPISGLQGVAHELITHLGHGPANHRDMAMELEQAIGDALLDIGREVLAEYGLPVQDSVGGCDCAV